MGTDGSDPLDAIIAEYVQAVESGATLNRAEFLLRHPAYAERLAAFFADFDRLGRGASQFKLPEVSIGESETLGFDPAAKPLRPTLRYLGDYELLGEIARGGMGVVYRAKQASLNRVVAVKMILAGTYASNQAVQRFRAEAEAAANLDHPNILPIYEVGEHEGHQYFSMKFIEGGSLSEAAIRNKGDAKWQGLIAAQLARAVQFAHQRGILHRDLKPANVLLELDGTPYITDFGLAKRVDADDGHTRTGSVVGTPSYMAPEQARGTKGLTTSVDIYSLGSILYELLAGQPPFRGETILDTLKLVTEREAVSPVQLNPKADRDLSVIALKCLQKDPSKRYPTAGELADDLERWNRGEPILARPVGRAERFQLWVKRNPGIAGLTLLAVSLLIVGSVVSLLFGIEARFRAGEAREAKSRAEENATAAQQSERASRKQLARTLMANGNRLTEVNDTSGALLWYIQAFEAEPEDAERTEIHRRRIGTFFRYAPRLASYEKPEREESVSYQTPSHFVNRIGPSEVVVRDTTTGKAVFGPIQLPHPINHLSFDPVHLRLVTTVRIELPNDKFKLSSRWWGIAEGKALTEWIEIGENMGHYLDRGDVEFLPDGALILRDAQPGRTPDEIAGMRPMTWLPTQPAPVPFPGVGSDGIPYQILMHSPDGERLIAVRYGDKGFYGTKIARVFDRDGKPGGAEFSVNVEWNTNYLFSKNSKTLVEWTMGESKVTFRDGRTGALTGELSHAEMREVKASPDGYNFALVGRNGIRVMHSATEGWSESTGTAALEVKFRPDGGAIAAMTTFPYHGIRVWSTAGPKPLSPMLTHPNVVGSFAFSADSRQLITHCEDGIRRWELPASDPQFLPGPYSNTYYYPKAKRAISFSKTELQIFDAETGKPVFPPHRFDCGLDGTTLFDDGERVLIRGAEDMKFRLFNARDGKLLELKHGLGLTGWPDVSADQTLAIFDDPLDKTHGILLDLRTGEPVGPPLNVDRRGLTPSFRYAMVGGGAPVPQPISILEIATRKTIALEGPGDPKWSGGYVSFGDRHFAAVDTNLDCFHIWDTPSGNKRKTVNVAPEKVLGLWATKNGSRILIRQSVGPYRLFDEQGNPVATIPGRAIDPVFSEDDRLVFLTGEGGTLRAYSTETGKPASPWLGQVGPGGGDVITTATLNGKFVFRDEGLLEVATGDPILPPACATRMYISYDDFLDPAGRFGYLLGDEKVGREWKSDRDYRLHPERDGVARFVFPTDERPIDELRTEAELRAGRRIDETGSMVNLLRDEVEERFRNAKPTGIPIPELDWHRRESKTLLPFTESVHLDRLLQLEPDNPTWCWRRAARYLIDGERERAGPLFAKAANLGLDSAEFHRAYGWYHHAGRDWADAEVEFTKSLDKNPFQNDTRGARGDVRMERGQIENALEDFARATRGIASHEWIKAHFVALLSSGRWAEALELASGKNNGIDPGEAYLAIYFGYAPGLAKNLEPFLENTKSNSEHERDKRTPSTGPADADFLFAYGGLLLRAGKYSEAKIELEKAAKRMPDHPLGWAYRAIAEVKLGNAAAATKGISKAEAWLKANASTAPWVELALVRVLVEEARGELTLHLHFPGPPGK